MANRPDTHARSMLPIPDRPKFGHTTYDAKDPETNFPPIEPLLPPEGAPNVLIVLLDDVGFGASTAFGGPCATPNAEKLAAGGLSYNRFHTTALCAPTRAATTAFCVVEGPMDVFAVEQTGYRGRFFVLKGHLSPLDGLGPEAIGIPELLARIEAGSFSEIILATNPTVEGEATAHYIAQMLADKHLSLTRIAHGVPLGGELEMVDGGTLAHALAGRRPMGS